MKYLIFALLAICFSFTNKASAEEILIYIRDDVYEDYISFLAGRDVLSIESFSGKTTGGPRISTPRQKTDKISPTKSLNRKLLQGKRFID